jgi:hypothetical protein
MERRLTLSGANIIIVAISSIRRSRNTNEGITWLGLEVS